MPNPQVKGLILATITALTWAFLPIGVSVGAQYVDTPTLVFLRFAIAALLLATFMAALKKLPIKVIKKPPPIILLAGLFLAANYFGYMRGVAMTSPSTAQVLIQSGPVLLVVLGVSLFKEPFSRWQVCGLIAAVLGFILFYSDQLPSVVTDQTRFQIGSAWVLFGGVTWTAYGVCHKYAVRYYSPQSINLVIYTTAALLFLPGVDFSSLLHLTPGQWAVLTYLGLNTLIAYGALAEALKYAPASKVGIIITLNPLLTIVVMDLFAAFAIDWVKLEPKGMYGYLGALMVVFGAIFVISLGKKSAQDKE